MRLWIVAFLTLISAPTFAAFNSSELNNFMQSTCSKTLFTTDGTYGKEYHLLTPRFSVSGSRALSVLADPTTGQLKITVRNEDGSLTVQNTAAFSFRRVLLIENSVWFLQDDQLVEYDLLTSQILGRYPTYTKPFELSLTTRARGFTYDKGYIYIAHGELGVVLFDVKAKKPYMVTGAGVVPASMAAAVEVQGSLIYVLQGAYHPDGFNGVMTINLSTGSKKTVSYPKNMGVVDPYSSTMTVTSDSLIINNSGWIHAYELKSLASAPKELAPTWVRVSEKIAADGGELEKFLMINGDLVAQDRTIFGCSSISYIPRGERRPITEIRFIDKPY